jgi:PAS domain S-box-containing protein
MARREKRARRDAATIGSNGQRERVSSGREVRQPKSELESAIQRYVDLYDFAPIAYVSFDRAGRIEEANLAATELLGEPRDRLIGRPFAFYTADLDSLLRHLLHCRTSQQEVKTELLLKNRKGEQISAVLLSTPITSTAKNGAMLYQTAIIDLRERKRAEAELELISRLPAENPEPVVRLKEGRINFCNPAAQNLLDQFDVKVGDTAPKEILEVAERGKANVELDFLGRCYSVAVAPIKKGNYVNLYFSDITDRKRAEAGALRLASVVQSSHDAIVAKDLNGIITDWNQSAQRIFGYKSKEIIGKSILTLIPPDRHDEETEIIRRIRRGQSIEHYETVRRRKDGTLVDVSLTISPIKDSRGKIVGVSKIARDITRQKNTERRLAEQARLLDLSNEAILVRDQYDRVTYWSRGARDMYGYSAAQAMGKNIHDLLKTRHSEPLQRINYKLERDGRWSGELIHKRKNGTQVIVMSNWVVDRDHRGKRAYVLETNSDITARKQADVALQRSKEMLEKLVFQRTRALRIANAELEGEIRRRKGLEGQILEISDREQERLGQELHDGLCQQLTAIGFLARATALRLKDHSVVQVDDLERIAQLINSSVMDARNIARGLHKEEIEAAELEHALHELVERKIWKTNCRLDLKTKIDIENDNAASQLYRILREAILNANKHSRATQIVLEVRRSKHDLIFSVRDNGTGFGKTRKAGEGLGFHIMKYRAESIGARLELESRKSGGVRVSVYLPLTKIK